MDALKMISDASMKQEVPAFGIGDTVKVMETRPLSKDKRWRLVEVVERVK